MRKTGISGSLIVLTLCGCTALSPELSEETLSSPPETFTTAKEDTSSAVSSSNAQFVAARFLGRPLSRAAAAGEYAVTDAKGDTTLRIINFSERGFVIVSGKKDYFPVLAHSETGSFDPELMQTTGASLWIDTNSSIVGNAEALADSVKTAARKEWNRYVYESVPCEPSVSSRSESDVYQMMYDQVQQWKNEGYTVMTLGDFKNSSEFQSLDPDIRANFTDHLAGVANNRYRGWDYNCFVLKKEVGKTIVIKNPLIHTLWGQGEPFNEYVPNKIFLGCTTIAAGQIMYYHRFPNNFDWNAMALNRFWAASQIDATAKFLYTLGKKGIGIEYDKNESGADIDKVKRMFLAYGYTKVFKQNHNKSAIIESLEEYCPVYMRGESNSSAHAWVCDGVTTSNWRTEYELWGLEDCPESYEPQMFINLYNYTGPTYSSEASFHYNWGYEGMGDGNFLDSDPTYTNPVNQASSSYYKKRKELIIKP